jgi:acylphosphatase
VSRCRLFRVSGRVQGVFFRASARTAARERNITGWARNLPGGDVEVLACGAEPDLQDFAVWLREGPPMAQVTRVSADDVPLSAPGSFDIRHD